MTESTSFQKAKHAKFKAFLAGETDEFDLWEVDPAEFTSISAAIADSFTITSAGGMAPFQAMGQITALAEDGTQVPMRWYYRSRHSEANLRVAMTQDECFGSSPLFWASMRELSEFDYSHWLTNLVALIPQLTPVPYPDDGDTRAKPDRALAAQPFRVRG